MSLWATEWNLLFKVKTREDFCAAFCVRGDKKCVGTAFNQMAKIEEVTDPNKSFSWNRVKYILYQEDPSRSVPGFNS